MTDKEKAAMAIGLIERCSTIPETFANSIRSGVWYTSEKTHDQLIIDRSIQFVDAISEFLDEAPDDNFFRDLFVLTGDHMVLTEEGWITAESNTDEETNGEPSEVLDEVNAPE